MDKSWLTFNGASDKLPTIPPGREDSVEPVPESPLDVDFIEDVVHSGVSGGAKRVADHHAALWMSRHGVTVERAKQFPRRFSLWAKLMRALLARLKTRAGVWALWDRVKFSAAIFGLLALLCASVASVFTLLRSTSIFADAPAACWFCALLVSAIPLSGKLVLEEFTSERVQRWLRVLLGLGSIGLFVGWAVLLAQITGGLGAPLPDVMSLVDGPGASAAQTGAHAVNLQWIQLLLEFFGSLCCFAYADLVHSHYRAERSEPTPLQRLQHLQLVEQTQALDAELKQASETHGHYQSLLAAQKAYCGRAVAAYEAVKRTEAGAARRELWQSWEAAKSNSRKTDTHN